MSLALIFAVFLAAPATAAQRRVRQVDRSVTDQTCLTELQIDVRSALQKGEIDPATARQFYLGIERLRRQIIIMGNQVSFRQKVRMREDRRPREARLEQKRAGQRRNGWKLKS